MDLPYWMFGDFLNHYDYVNIGFLETGIQAEYAPYVVMAHTIGILSTNSRGINVLAQDHTGTCILALRGESAGHFYDEHLRRYDPHETIVEPYALGQNWFQTCLFKLDWTRKVVVNGRIGHVVTQMCMVKAVIDDFVEYKMGEEEYHHYCSVISTALPMATGLLDGNRIEGSHIPAGPTISGGFRRRIYGPYNL